jgi:hypothetical protein
MDRQEIQNRIFRYFREQLTAMDDPHRRPQIQMGFLNSLFEDVIRILPQHKGPDVLSVAREIVHELMNIGAVYPGGYGQVHGSDFYPWVTITEYGKELFAHEDWLPYDPEGYIRALKVRVPEIDDVTLAYAGESIAAFNRRNLLSATLTLGVASENLMLLLIEAYVNFLKTDPKRQAALQKRIADRWIYTQYKEFKQDFSKDVKLLPKELQGDWETYLDGVFNFIRVNRNAAGHPTGKQQSAKVVYANLQIFADYARYISDLIKFFK